MNRKREGEWVIETKCSSLYVHLIDSCSSLRLNFILIDALKLSRREHTCTRGLHSPGK